MKRIKTRVWSALLAAALLVSLCIPAAAVSADELRSAAAKSAAYMLDTVQTPQVGSTGGEWAILGLARSGYAVPQAYWDGYYAAVEDYVAARGGVLHTRKHTEYSRVIVALTAIGADPTDVAGCDLLKPLGDFDKTLLQGINGPIWAMIALDCGGYEVPVNPEAKTQATRQMYVNEILRRQRNDGGWDLTAGSGKADPDITGMALQALARYQNIPAVKMATEKALTCLSGMQDAAGGFADGGASSCESVVQVIVALCELGIDLNDKRFVKNGHSLLDNLWTYRSRDGGFRHTADGTGNDRMASEQGLYGIAAALRAAQGKNSLYRMDDCEIRVSGTAGGEVGLPGRHADVQKKSITAPGATFADIAAHPNRTAIEALAARGIVNGYTAASFGPNDTLTRAQFAAMVVRALGLPGKKVDVFTDIDPEAWYAAAAGSAYTYGITTGKTATTFVPGDTITRQQAAVMVARAAKLCGMDTDLEDREIRSILAPFGDYTSVGAWAQEGAAFCYREGILSPDDLNIEPFRPVLRCEMAQMLYNLLSSAKLL